ncbi:hypothetical protein [Fulvivirga sp.]|uniref:hypothetical protein n=2 Tax=Fulvivirga sp. TaxID=1931237 RepID=UPI0032EADAAE
MMESHESNEGVKLTDQALKNLNETRKWTMFISIVGFVFVALMVLIALFIGSVMSNLPTGSSMPISKGFATVIYLVIAAIYFFPIYYLYKFSAHMKIGIVSRSQEDIDIAFKNLNAHYKFLGVLVAIVIAFYVFVLIGITAFGALVGA